MEDYNVGYVPNLSQKIARFTDGSAGLYTNSTIEPKQTVDVYAGMLSKSFVEFMATESDGSWFHAAFRFYTGINYGGKEYPYIGVNLGLPNIFDYVAGDFRVTTSDKYGEIVLDSNFELIAFATNMPTNFNIEIIYDLGAETYSLEQLNRYEPIEI